jgi:hypothetical protein
MNRNFTIVILFILFPIRGITQNSDSSFIHKTVYKGDSIYVVSSDPVYINSNPSKAYKRNDYDRYTRLIFNLKKVYPYSKLIKVKLKDLNDGLAKCHNEKDRKEYLKNKEKDLFSQYEEELKNLTISQGRLLLKLIDRETQQTTYDLIKEYKGPVSAIFWQSIARIFGSNLKSTYDPYGEDQLIEELLQLLDKGML